MQKLIEMIYTQVYTHYPLIVNTHVILKYDLNRNIRFVNNK